MKPAGFAAALAVLLYLGMLTTAEAQPGLVDFTADPAARPTRVLLVGEDRDHPPGTHEYMAGLKVLAKCLQRVPQLEITLVHASKDWPEGPALLDEADVLVLYVGEGAKWVQAADERFAAFERLCKRKAGLVAIHWAIGAKDAKYITPYRELLGAIHGGPDRKYTYEESLVRVVEPKHPVLRGIGDFRIKDEWYYRLKRTSEGKLTPLLTVELEGEEEMVGWALERADGGRSFGFCGMHYHENWGSEPLRRLHAQAVLWTAGLPIPDQGLAVPLEPDDLKLP